MGFRFRLRPWAGAAARRARLWCALAAAAILLDGATPIDGVTRADFGVTAAILIAQAIVSFFKGFGGSSSSAVLRAFNDIRTSVISLGRALTTGLWGAALALAKVVASMRNVWPAIIKPALLTLNRWITTLATWLRTKFGPVLRFIARVKDELDKIYKRFVRPILDTIDFIRFINRTLHLFHIDVLQGLEDALTKLEQRIEEPFIWIRTRLTLIENWINRIVTLDGFLQRITLLSSMDRYAPEWVRSFWDKQVKGLSPEQAAAARAVKYPSDEPEKNGIELSAYYRGRTSTIGPLVDELVPLWREAAGVRK